MKIKFSVLICSSILISFAFGARLTGGPDSELHDKSKQYERKAAKGLDEEPTTDEESSEPDESEQFAKLIDLNFPGAGIKIIKAPDLSKDSDSKKISETLAMMLESQEKWIQKFEEELEEMNKSELPVEPVIEKTADEIEGKCFIHDISHILSIFSF